MYFASVWSITRMTLPRVQPIIPIARKEPFDNPAWLFSTSFIQCMASA